MHGPRRAADRQLIGQVSADRLLADIRHLSTAWPTRHTLSRHHRAQAVWLSEQLERSGWPTRRESWSIPSAETKGKSIAGINVVGELKGKRPRSPVTVLCAHFDSRQQSLGDPDAPAPGANDNASGVAALLECARLLARHSETRRDTIRIAFFSGEELGLLGSRCHTDRVENRSGIRFVLNLDQIGFPPADRAVHIDRDDTGDPKNNAASAKLSRQMQQIAAELIKVPTRFAPAEGSDYLSYERHGIPIVGLYEAGKEYPDYHRSTDTWDKVDVAYVVDMTRLALATVLELARTN